MKVVYRGTCTTGSTMIDDGNFYMITTLDTQENKRNYVLFDVWEKRMAIWGGANSENLIDFGKLVKLPATEIMNYDHDVLVQTEDARTWYPDTW